MGFSIITFRAGNLVVPNLGAEVSSDVTSSSGPVKLEDLQRILSNIGPAGMSLVGYFFSMFTSFLH